jgi:hypothetical protein
MSRLRLICFDFSGSRGEVIQFAHFERASNSCKCLIWRVLCMRLSWTFEPPRLHHQTKDLPTRRPCVLA